MDDSTAAAAPSTKLYPIDLVSYRSVHGLAMVDNWACPPTDEFIMIPADGVEITKKAGDTDITLLDRSYLRPGQIVLSASDVGGQMGVVTGVATVADLVQLDDTGQEKKVIYRGVPPSDLRRVRALCLGDYVVSGPWLGRVVEVSLDVEVVLDDGSVCRVTDDESKEYPLGKIARCYRPQENTIFFPGMRVVNNVLSAFFRGSRWIKGHKKLSLQSEEGTVSRVEMAGVLVHWIASPHLGTNQQLVQESAPPAYQSPRNLTFFCSDSHCCWAVADRCFLHKSRLSASASSEINGVGDGGSSVPVPDYHHQDEQDDTSSPSPAEDPPTTLITKKEQEERSTYLKKHKNPTYLGHRPADTRSAPLSTMAISNTHTTVDVLWQDGTRQHGAPSTSLSPFKVMNEDEFFPGQYVVDATADVIGDDVVMDMGAAKAPTRRIGVVKSVNSKDHTVNVSWFKVDPRLDEASNRWEPECDDTVSAYDLDQDPDHSVFYGDVVVRLLSNVSESTPLVQQPKARCNEKSAPADLSWVGRVVDLRDGHVQVRWGDGSTSTVLPHEISVAYEEYYKDLQAEMGDWLEDDKADASQEIGTTNWDNDPHDDPVDDTSVEGGVEGGDSSVNELDGFTATRTCRLCGVIQSMVRAIVQVLARGKWYLVNWSLPSHSDLPKTTNDVEVPAQVSTGTQQDPSIVAGAATEASFALVTKSDASVDKDDSTENMDKARKANTDGDASSFPHFDVLQSPPDHHFLDNMDQGNSGGKVWAKAVQKEWKILENSLPGTIYVRSYDDRMDLLRAAMVGASGTPYQDGLFFFDMHLPPSYPDVPPQVYYHSFGLRLNPNLYESGTVCLSLLDTFDGEETELWTPGTSSLLQVVVSIQALVLNNHPFYNEDGYEDLVDKPEGHRNALPYSENAFLLTLRTMLHLLRRPPQGFEGFVKDHFRRRGKHVLATCQAYLQGCVAADEGSMELPCSAGFRITLTNLVPRLVAAFRDQAGGPG